MKALLHKHRGILALLALLVLVGVALGGAIPFIYRDLPEPAKANRQDLLRWLITKDIAKETPAIQLTLASRLEAEFGSGVDWTAFQGKLNDSQRKQLIENIPSVLRPWMLEKAEVYERLSTDGRRAFLDRMLDTLDVWKGIEKLIPESAANAQNETKSPKLATILMQEMEILQREIPDSQKKQVGELWTAIQMRWFLRSLAPKT
jgi:hypothetical protein